MSTEPIVLKKIVPSRKQVDRKNVKCMCGSNFTNGEFKASSNFEQSCNSSKNGVMSWTRTENDASKEINTRFVHGLPSCKMNNKQFTDTPQKVYRINSQLSLDKSSTKIPLIPYKPHYLRPEYSNQIKPLVPPKVKNTDAVIQRRQLTEEYFENIIRNVDDDFTDSCRTGSDSSNQTDCKDSVKSDIQCASAEFDTEISYHVQSEHSNLTSSLKVLKLCGWYWGDMTWKEAEEMLEQKPDEIGLFLLRDSQDPLHILTVTVRTDIDTIRHIRVEFTEGKFQLCDPSRGSSRGAATCVRHANIVSFVKLAMKHSRNGNFLYFIRPRGMGQAPIQIQLLTPISRFSCVKSLKYYSRFVIRNLLPQESVAQLPIPPELQRYLSKSHYFDADEDLPCALRS